MTNCECKYNQVLHKHVGPSFQVKISLKTLNYKEISRYLLVSIQIFNLPHDQAASTISIAPTTIKSRWTSPLALKFLTKLERIGQNENQFLLYSVLSLDLKNECVHDFIINSA